MGNYTTFFQFTDPTHPDSWDGAGDYEHDIYLGVYEAS